MTRMCRIVSVGGVLLMAGCSGDSGANQSVTGGVGAFMPAGAQAVAAAGAATAGVPVQASGTAGLAAAAGADATPIAGMDAQPASGAPVAGAEPVNAGDLPTCGRFSTEPCSCPARPQEACRLGRGPSGASSTATMSCTSRADVDSLFANEVGRCGHRWEGFPPPLDGVWQLDMPGEIDDECPQGLDGDYGPSPGCCMPTMYGIDVCGVLDEYDIGCFVHDGSVRAAGADCSGGAPCVGPTLCDVQPGMCTSFDLPCTPG